MPSHPHRHRHRRRRPRFGVKVGPAVVVLTILAAGFLLLTVSSLAQGRRNLLLVAASSAEERWADARSRGATAVASSRWDRATRAALRFASALPLRALKLVPLFGSPGRALSAAVDAGAEGLAAGRIIAEASSSFPTSASATVDGHDLGPFHAAAARSETAVEEAGRPGHLPGAAVEPGERQLVARLPDHGHSGRRAVPAPRGRRGRRRPGADRAGHGPARRGPRRRQAARLFHPGRGGGVRPAGGVRGRAQAPARRTPQEVPHRAGRRPLHPSLRPARQPATAGRRRRGGRSAQETSNSGSGMRPARSCSPGRRRRGACRLPMATS